MNLSDLAALLSCVSAGPRCGRGQQLMAMVNVGESPGSPNAFR
jgi:hypothetical protein